MLNALAHLLNDKSLSELMWNSYDSAFAECEGKIIEITTPFGSRLEFEDFLQSLMIYSPSVKSDDPYFDGILPDGSRFHVTRPPCSPMGPTLTIRKFSTAHRSFEGLLSSGFLTEKAVVFLTACVRTRINIVISGATGAGKTTLLNVLASAVSPSERIITVEDVPEIQIQHKNWVRLLAVRDRPGCSVRECLTGSLRMRPDRILVGECRSSETLEMLQIMNTGHDGGMTTVHANSSSEALTRLESLILFHAGADVPLRALRRQIVDAIDLIVHVGRTADGQRRVEEILEVVGMEGEVITRSSLFKIQGPDERLKATGHVPTFMTRLKAGPISFPPGFFERDTFESTHRKSG